MCEKRSDLSVGERIEKMIYVYVWLVHYVVQQKLTQHDKAILLLLCLVAKLCLTDSCSPMDCNPPGSSVHGISQARILEWVAISFSRDTSQSRDQTYISCITGRFFTTEPPGKPEAITLKLKKRKKKRQPLKERTRGVDVPASFFSLLVLSRLPIS